ncbi:hypothetical protein [Frateuria sp.]|uniref:hypothetical protein n=1 Tax=Frateuria sp. TaxID=2211372 RepID=UPI003F7F9760
MTGEAKERVAAEDLQQLALRLSAFANVLGEHAEHLVAETARGTQTLKETAQGLGLQAGQLARELAASVGQEVRAGIERNVSVGMRQGGERLQSACDAATRAASAMERELDRMRRLSRSVLWRSGLALLVGAVLAAGGSGYLAWRNHQAIERAQFSADLLEAIRSGAIRPCGDGLCARLATDAPHYGTHGEYRRIH